MSVCHSQKTITVPSNRLIKILTVGMVLSMTIVALFGVTGGGDMGGTVLGAQAGMEADSTAEATVDGAAAGFGAGVAGVTTTAAVAGAGIATGGSAWLAGAAVAA
jgi:hypothetical protein